MAAREQASLLDIRPEFIRYLSPDEAAELAGIALAVLTVADDEDELGALLTRQGAFGATILDGLVTKSLRVGEQTGIQLLGPGDLLAPGGDLLPAWISRCEWRAAGRVRLALLDSSLLAAAYRWPRIVQGVYTTLGDQLQRLSAQAVICQLPRVDDRVLAMLWLLSETWGQVTPSGVRLPLALTHETLGALIGAARPTVTLALRKLTTEGAVVHQDMGWLLLKAPPDAAGAAWTLSPEVMLNAPDRWTNTDSQARAQAEDEAQMIAYAELRETIRRLRESHQADRLRMSERLDRIRGTRSRASETRARIQEDAIRRRRPPSS